MASNLVPITVAYGDGIGPEIMAASLHIMKAAGARIQEETIEIGEKVYLRGVNSGIEPSAWESLRRTQVFFKAPITTPQGGGFKSLNVTTRKTLGLYANVRPCVSYHPYVQTKHLGMDVVIVRENEEDLYAGIEHRQTEEVYQCLKLISRPGSEKIIRYAFEYARRNNRKKVTCFSKDNIMKFTDGLFHKVFDEIGAEYPEFEKEHWIVDIGAAKMADAPEAFDVIVMENLYGDILSDVAAQISYSKAPKQNAAHTMKTGGGAKKILVGVDTFFDWKQRNPEEFGKKLEQLNGDGLKLFAVSNRGTEVYPEGFTETFCTDHWRARFMGNGAVSHAQIVALLDRAGKANLDFIKIENLYTFDGQKGFVAEGE